MLAGSVVLYSPLCRFTVTFSLSIEIVVSLTVKTTNTPPTTVYRTVHHQLTLPSLQFSARTAKCARARGVPQLQDVFLVRAGAPRPARRARARAARAGRHAAVAALARGVAAPRAVGGGGAWRAAGRGAGGSAGG